MVPLDGVNEQQLINYVMTICNKNDDGLVDNQIAEINTQQNIDDIIDDIGRMDGDHTKEQMMCRLTRATHSQCLTRTYYKEYQMAAMNDHNNLLREVRTMTKLKPPNLLLESCLLITL